MKLGIVENELEKIVGSLLAINRDTTNGWYELEIGISSGWIFNSTKDIKCEVVVENDEYKLLKIMPKKKGVNVDDLIYFVEKIHEVNKQIEEREKRFASKISKIKKSLEKEAEEFYSELETYKKSSFESKFIEALKNDDEEQEVNADDEVSEIIENSVSASTITKKKRGRPPKKQSTNGTR